MRLCVRVQKRFHGVFVCGHAGVEFFVFFSVSCSCYSAESVVINDLIGMKSFFPSETGALGEDRTSTLPVPSQKGIHCAPTRPCAHGFVEDSDIHILSYMNDQAFLYSQHIHHHTDP